MYAKSHNGPAGKISSEDSFFVETLKSLAECPVCLEIPRTGKFYLCQNSHSICEDCYRKLDRDNNQQGQSYLVISLHFFISGSHQEWLFLPFQT